MGGGRCGGRGDGPQQEGEGEGEAEEKDHHQGDQGEGGQGLKNGDHDDPWTVGFELVPFEVAAHAEGDEGQGHVGDEVHALDDLQRQKIQGVRPDGDPRQDIAGDVGQVELFCDPGGQEAGQEHDGEGEGDTGRGGREGIQMKHDGSLLSGRELVPSFRSLDYRGRA